MTQVDVSTTMYYLFYGSGPVLAIGAWLIGLVLHGLGRSTTLALAVVVFAIGLVMGSALSAALGFLQRQPSIGTVVGSMWFLAVPLIGVIVLAWAGKRRAAGLLITGTAVPWTAIWGWYAVEVLRGRDGATLLILAMFLAGLGPLLIGVTLIAAGDPVPLPDSAAPMGRPGSRRPGSMGHRLIAEATYGAVGPAFVLAFVAASAVGIVFSGQLVLQLVIAVAAAAIGTEIELRWIPPRVRPAIESFHWVGLGELARFRAATGEATPTSINGFRTWLARHPESDATQPWRIEMLNFLGEHGEARAEIERWSPASPFERIHRASLTAEIGWQEGGPADLPALASEAAETGRDGSPDRLAADGLVAWWSSRTALAAMDPGWQHPLATFRARLGDTAYGLHAKALRRRTIALPMIVAVGFVFLGQVAAALTAGALQP
jgi:hypothetical protein